MRCIAVTKGIDPQRILDFREFDSFEQAKQHSPAMMRRGTYFIELEDLDGFKRWKFDGKWHRMSQRRN
jgi:hypothetical protein